MQSLEDHKFLQIPNSKTNHSGQLFGVSYEEITLLEQEDYHLSNYSLVYTEDFHVILCQMLLISLQHHELLMKD